MIAGGVFAPDDADVEHIEMIIGLYMHTAVSVVVTVGHNHAVQIVFVLRLHPIFNTLVGDRKGLLASFFLYGFGFDLRCEIDVSGNLIPVPERDDEPEAAGGNKNIADFHR